MGIAARVTNVAAGLWLLLSAVVWPHTLAQRADTWIAGALMAFAAALALRSDRMRYVNTALALWLFFFTLLVPRASAATAWNNVVLSIVVLFLSLVPTRATARTLGQPLRDPDVPYDL